MSDPKPHFPELQLTFAECRVLGCLLEKEAMQGFIEYPLGPLVVRNPAGGGRRVETYTHLLGGTPPGDGLVIAEAGAEVVELEEEQAWRGRMEHKIQDLQANVEELTAMVRNLRAELGGG